MKLHAFQLTYCYTMNARFKGVDYNMKVHIREKIYKFFLLETTSMPPPPWKFKTKGAPKKDKHIVWLTKRSPSLWEHVDSRDPDTQVSYSKSTGSSRISVHKSNMSPNPPPVKVNIQHKDKISLFMHEFIEKVMDVVDNCHCWFGVVASLRHMSINDYQIIHH